MEDLRERIDILIDEKIEENPEYLRFTYYEVMVKNKTKKELEKEFIRLARIKLGWMNYTTYIEGEEFIYNGARIRVQSNELLIAIKKGKGDKQ